MKKLLVLFFSVVTLTLSAQENTNPPSTSYSVDQAIAYGLKHNYDYLNAKSDVEIARMQVKETTAIGLPQISSKVSNTNYINIPTTLMPDFISAAVYGVNENAFGLTPVVPLPSTTQYFPVTFGTKYNASAEVNVSQLVFSGEYLVGLKASKTYQKQSLQALEKTEQNLRESIRMYYYLALSLRSQREIIEKTLAGNEKMLAENRVMFKKGYIEDTEVSQLEILVSNLKANIRHLGEQEKTTVNYLKMFMGMPLEEELVLTDKLDHLLEASLLGEGGVFNPANNIDFRLMQTQIALSDLQIKQAQSAYLPQLSAFFTAQTNAMRDNWDFFDSKGTWYPTTLWGVNLSIPIWSSGSRYSKVQQAKLARLKLEQSEKQLDAGLRLQVATAQSDLRMHTSEYNINKKNLELSEKIYQKTQTKYKEGVASSFDLIQAHNAFLEASKNYTISILNVLNDKNTLDNLFAKPSNTQIEN